MFPANDEPREKISMRRAIFLPRSFARFQSGLRRVNRKL